MRPAAGEEGMRIGIFGGTFNPVHLGHLITAEEIRQVFRLDRIVFVPSARPPHKPSPHLVAAEHRLEMVRRAIQGNPFFDLSSLEVDRPGYSYSVETVEAFERDLGDRADLSFLLGIDAFLELDSWHAPDRLLRLCHFIIISRPTYSFEDARSVLSENFGISSAEGAESISLPGGHHLYFSEVTPIGISSTLIRSRLRGGRSVKYLLPEPVESYILSHHLYAESE
jgi:nicotinate-nucleotide adenylyltransferase